MSDDTPTQRLPSAAGELAEEKKKSKTLLAILIAAGGALLIAIIILLIVLLSGRDNGGNASPDPSNSASASESPSPTPSESDSPEPSPSPTPTESEAPPPPPPSAIVSYTVSDKNVDCSGVSSVPITFNWNTTGNSVTFGVGTDNADAEPYQTGLPGVGGITIDYQCGQAGGQQKYAIAVYHNDDVIARQTIVIHE